jgi:hypothetical protein
LGGDDSELSKLPAAEQKVLPFPISAFTSVLFVFQYFRNALPKYDVSSQVRFATTQNTLKSRNIQENISIALLIDNQTKRVSMTHSV